MSTADEREKPAQRVSRFMGHFEQSLDDRGRLSLPAKFREKLDDVVVIAKGKGRYLLGFPLPEWEAISVGMDQLTTTNEEHFSALELVYAFASDEEIDKQGRILIPAVLRQYAELKDSVIIEGLNKRFAIWDKHNWDIQQRVLDATGPRIIQGLGDRGIKL